jgi:DNA-binding CsgD family transcriptional regulator
MLRMLQSFSSVMEADSRDEFRLEVVRFTRALGFDTVSATVVIDQLQGDPKFITVENTPAEYLETSRDASRGRRDPVSQHCKVKGVPIVWDQSTYVNAGCGELWEHQAPFGFRHGVSLAIHLPQGRHFWLGVDRDQAFPKDPAEVTRMVAMLQLFAVHAQEVAMHVLWPKPVEQKVHPRLTARELECLRWTLEGKTAWELGRILDIAEQTAVRHTFNASKKLGCVNKHQAAVRALRLGLIG